MFEAFSSIRDLENAGFRRALTKPRVAPRVEGLKKDIVERLLDDYSDLSLSDGETEDEEEREEGACMIEKHARRDGHEGF